MLEVILDVETTGLSTTENHRIVEIGCIELNNQIATNKIFHEYINPQRSISEEAFKIHGYDAEFLSDKKNTVNEQVSKQLSELKAAELIETEAVETEVVETEAVETEDEETKDK